MHAEGQGPTMNASDPNHDNTSRAPESESVAGRTGSPGDIDLTTDVSAIGTARSRRFALGDAADLLEDVVARPGSDPRWTLRVADALQGLRAAFAAHVTEVERDDGLLPRLRADAPRLSNGIQHMYDEHESLTSGLEATAELVRGCEGECSADVVSAIREAAVDLLRSISLHRQRGADLVYEAYNVDIGGG